MNLICHIGYPKAGSSALQKFFFSKLTDITFLGIYPQKNVGVSVDTQPQKKIIYQTDKKVWDCHNRLVNYENWNSAAEVEEFNLILSKYRQGNHPVLLSSEFITSVFFSYPHIQEKLQRIKILGVNKILIILRNQVELLKSMYRDHPFDPGNLVHGAPVSFSEWIRLADDLNPSPIESLDFARMISKTEEIFGKENCLPLLFEQIFDRPETISSQLSTFLQSDLETCQKLLNSIPIENRGVSGRFNWIRRFKNKLLGSFPISNYLPPSMIEPLKDYLKKGPKAEVKTTIEDMEWLSIKYNEGNLAVESKYSLPLNRYQYP